LEAIQAAAPSLSFEFYPPQGPDATARMLRRAERLDRLAPDFVAVTYGAGGRGAAGQAASVEAAAALRSVTRAALVAHLTLVGQSVQELSDAVRRLTAAGAEAFMALRGDPPGGPAAPWVADGALTYASELVALIREISDAPIGVAAFPLGHPTARSLEHDAAVLALKQAAGADFAVTQVMFDAEDYSRLVARAQRAGATLPLVPGVIPITATASVARLELLSGAPLPAALADQLARAEDGAAREAVGVAWSVALGRALLERGAPGIHLYTLNTTAAAEQVCRELGLGGAARV
jgi:methylenetetrahydrofolate reductase (NADPH)